MHTKLDRVLLSTSNDFGSLPCPIYPQVYMIAGKTLGFLTNFFEVDILRKLDAIRNAESRFSLLSSSGLVHEDIASFKD